MIFNHVDCGTQELCHDFMGIYSFPGQFWLEKGVPFMLPEALNPPSTGCGCPLLLFPLTTYQVLTTYVQPQGGRESSTRNGESGKSGIQSQLCWGDIAHDLWDPQNGLGIDWIRRASCRLCHLSCKRRKGKRCSWKEKQVVLSGWGSRGDTAPKVRLNESAELKAPLSPTPLTLQSPGPHSSQIPQTSTSGHPMKVLLPPGSRPT